MAYIHKSLANGRWNELSYVEQTANVGSEVGRAINWKNKGNQAYSQQAFYRALELLELTKKDPKNRERLKEPCRVYEMLVDYFAGNNQYHSTDEQWEKYFYASNYAVRINK